MATFVKYLCSFIDRFFLIFMLLSPLSNIAYLSDRNEVIYFLYFVVNSCGTPLVYYLGIEENRRQAQDYFRTI